jgi:hypothetical protein
MVSPTKDAASVRYTLLVWNSIPDSLTFYAIPSTHQAAKWAAKANNLLINVDDIDDAHPLNLLNEWLVTDEAEAMAVETPIKGLKINRIVTSGFNGM